MKIIAPTHGEPAYAHAVREFADIYEKITGLRPDTVTEDDGKGDAVIIVSKILGLHDISEVMI